MHNHLPENYYIGNKKALFYNLKRFYDLQGKNVFTIIPQTFHISGGVEDPHYADFLAHFRSLEERKRTDKDFRNMWILKPGENTNRGNGISVCSALE